MAWLLAVAAALSATGCDRKSDAAQEAAAAERRDVEAEQQRRDKLRAKLQKKLDEANRPAAVYGAPPRPDAATKKPQGPCNCAPDDPLCDCR
jgi:hypothetical protein